MRGSDSIRVLVLEGPPRERGQIHGETLRAEIGDMVEAWKNDINRDLGVDPDLFLKEFIAKTDFLPAIRRWTPGLLEEVEGIAEGSGIAFNTILARQLSDEEPWFRLEKRYPVEISFGEQCSSVGVSPWNGHPAIVAQNMDSPGYYDGFQVLVHIKDPETRIEAFIFTIAGKLSLAGMNSRSMGMCCNTVLQLNYVKDGLPEDFVVRGFLAQPTLDEGLAFMRRVKHASGQNYIVGGPNRVLDLEISANKICEFTPYPGADRVYHTNHPLCNDDQSIWHKRWAMGTPAERQAVVARSTSLARFKTLESRLGDPHETITVERIRDVLSSHDGPVCLDGQGTQNITSGCLIMELSPAPVLHLSPGPPCSTPFKTYRFGA
jgi:hypothetical protein